MISAELRFENGKCVALFVVVPGGDGVQQFNPADLVRQGHLTFTDRFILDQLAVRVDAVARELARAAS